MSGVVGYVAHVFGFWGVTSAVTLTVDLLNSCAIISMSVF